MDRETCCKSCEEWGPELRRIAAELEALVAIVSALVEQARPLLDNPAMRFALRKRGK